MQLSEIIFGKKIVFLFSYTAGWLLGYLDGEFSNGSILPSWSLHTIMNMFSCLLLFIVQFKHLY